MLVSVHLELVAWSADGGTALVRQVDEAGDDRRVAWLVVNAAGVRAFPVSRTERGDEAVDAAACRAAAKELGARMASFRDAKVRPERCEGDRVALVEVSPAGEEHVERSWSPEGVEVRRAGRTLRIAVGEGDVEVVKLDRRPRLVAWAAAGPLVLVVEPGEGTDTLLAAVVDTPSGLVPVDLADPSAPALAAAR